MASPVAEFFAMALVLGGQQNVFLGSPVAPDATSATLRHFQLFRQGEVNNALLTSLDVFDNSAEQHADGCIYAATTPPTGPYWYDTYGAEDGAFRDHAVRTPPWLSAWPFLDPRSLAELEEVNHFPANWAPVSVRYDWDRDGAQGGPYPLLSGPAPRWYQLCVPPGGPISGWTLDTLRQIPSPTTPSVGKSGAYCNWDTAGIGTAFGTSPLEWSALEQVAGEWISRIAEGIVTNSFLSGQDATIDHAGPPEGFDLGNPHPFIGTTGCEPSRDFLQDPSGYFTLLQQLCNDWEMNVELDPEFRYLLAPPSTLPASVDCNSLRGGAEECARGNAGPDLGGNLGLEIEQWQVPVAYRPRPGDRIHVVGRWMIDCGHDDWHTELHPVELLQSSHALTSRASTRGAPATETNVVITGAWQGGDLEFDVWPPARPAVGAQLRFTRGAALGAQQFIESLQIISEEALPRDNPNHVHVHVSAPRQPHSIGVLGGVDYNASLRLATQYHLWWDVPPPPGPPAGGGSGRN
jgi:hypothetical protein